MVLVVWWSKVFNQLAHHHISLHKHLHHLNKRINCLVRIVNLVDNKQTWKLILRYQILKSKIKIASNVHHHNWHLKCNLNNQKSRLNLHKTLKLKIHQLEHPLVYRTYQALENNPKNRKRMNKSNSQIYLQIKDQEKRLMKKCSTLLIKRVTHLTDKIVFN